MWNNIVLDFWKITEVRYYAQLMLDDNKNKCNSTRGRVF